MRVVASSARTILESSTPRAVTFVEMAFPSGTQRLANSNGSFSWNGYTWTGIGRLIEFKPLREVPTGEITGGEITLAGGAPSDISDALTENVRGSAVTIYQAVLSEEMVIYDVITETVCQADRFRIVHSAQGAKLILAIESEIALARREKVRRWTYEDQRTYYPADTGMKHLTRMKEFIIRFPTADAMRR